MSALGTREMIQGVGLDGQFWHRPLTSNFCLTLVLRTSRTSEPERSSSSLLLQASRSIRSTSSARLSRLNKLKSFKQVQGWLRRSQLTTTMNVYIHQVDDGLGSADAWDDILGDARGHLGATEGPEAVQNATESKPSKRHG